MNETTALLILASFVIAAFLIGWNAAVSKYRQRQRRTAASVRDVKAQIVLMNDRLNTDEKRAAIDMGKTYAANQMQTTIDRLKDELP